MSLTINQSRQLGREHFEMEQVEPGSFKLAIHEIKHVEQLNATDDTTDNISAFWSGYDEAKREAEGRVMLPDMSRLGRGYAVLCKGYGSGANLVYERAVAIAECSLDYSYGAMIVAFWRGYDEMVAAMVQVRK